MAGQDTDLYQTMLTNLVEQARYLDEHCYYGVAFTEHHLQVEGITVSNNPVMLDQFIAARTHNIRVGQLGLILPPSNPLRVADNLTDPAAYDRAKREIYGECIDIIKFAWTRPTFPIRVSTGRSRCRTSTGRRAICRGKSAAVSMPMVA